MKSIILATASITMSCDHCTSLHFENCIRNITGTNTEKLITLIIHTEPGFDRVLLFLKRDLRWICEVEGGLTVKLTGNGYKIHNTKSGLVCSLRCPVKSFMNVFFIMALYGEIAFWGHQ